MSIVACNRLLCVILVIISVILHASLCEGQALRSLRRAGEEEGKQQKRDVVVEASSGEVNRQSIILQEEEMDKVLMSEEDSSSDEAIIQDIRAIFETTPIEEGGPDKVVLGENAAEVVATKEEEFVRHHRHLEASLSKLSRPARFAMQRLDRAREGMEGPYRHLPWVCMKSR